LGDDDLDDDGSLEDGFDRPAAQRPTILAGVRRWSDYLRPQRWRWWDDDAYGIQDTPEVQRVRRLFEQARADFGHPCLRLTVDSTCQPPFFICGGSVNVNEKKSGELSEGALQGILRHEVAHYSVFPKYFRNTLTTLGVLRRVLGNEYGHLTTEARLIISDCIVEDYMSRRFPGGAERFTEGLSGSEALKNRQHPVMQLFNGAMGYVHGITMPGVLPAAALAGERMIDCLRRIAPLECRIEEAAEVLVEYLRTHLDSQGWSQDRETLTIEVTVEDASPGQGGQGQGGQGRQEGPQDAQDGAEGDGEGEGSQSEEEGDQGDQEGQEGSGGDAGQGKPGGGVGGKRIVVRVRRYGGHSMSLKGAGGQGQPGQSKKKKPGTSPGQPVGQTLRGWKNIPGSPLNWPVVSAVMDAVREALHDSGLTSTCDLDGEDDNERMEVLENLSDKELQALRCNGKGYGTLAVTNLPPLWAERIAAMRQVKYRATVTRAKGGLVGSGGAIPWTLGDQPELLDVELTLENAGIILPGVSTLRYEPKEGGGEPVRARPAVQIILDTSGSMDQQLARRAILALVEAARVEGTEVSLILFSGSVWLQRGFSCQYNTMEAEAWQKYASGGTEFKPAVKAAWKVMREARLREKALIICATDWREDDESVAAMLGYLEEMKKEGHLVNVLHMNRQAWIEEYGYMKELRRRLDALQPVAVERMEDLAGLVLGSFDQAAGQKVRGGVR
jgi:Mg-chelatase subunit ChlD